MQTKNNQLPVSIALLLIWLCSSASFAINRDGQTDIWWRHATSGDNAGWIMTGTNYSSSVTMAYKRETDWKMVSVGDFDNDGDLDILWRNSQTGENALWFMSGQYFKCAQYIQPMTDTNWEIVATGYFDAGVDKSIDILWRNKVTGDNAIWYMNGATLQSSVLIQEVPDLNWKVGGTGDFNNDGNTDILWRNGATGEVAVWYMQGSTYVTCVWSTPMDLNWDCVGTGYFDSNNKIDILLRHKTNGDSAIWLMDGVTYLSSQLLPTSDPGWKVGGTGDSRASFDPGTIDSLPDIWERRFIGHLNYGNSDDPDGDGQSNLTESQNGSDPMQSNSLVNLGNALDANTMVWTTGGNVAWFPTNSEHYFGTYSARSGVIGNSSTSYLETQVMGPGNLSFYWKVSSAYGDYLRVYYQSGGYGTSGNQDWQLAAVNVGPGLQTVRWEYSTDSSGLEGQNAGFLDYIRFVPAPSDSGALETSLAHAVDNPNLTDLNYSTGWFRQTTTSYYGGDAAQSYFISNDSYTTMSTTVTGPGRVTFFWKVSSEANRDFLNFYLNGLPTAAISGEAGWESKSFDVPSGSVTMMWQYRKDYSGWAGQDTAWVDYVTYVPDLDADGLSDTWENQYFGNISTQNGSGDYDGDGVSNLQEYLNGTNPTLPELRVRVTSPRTSSLLP